MHSKRLVLIGVLAAACSSPAPTDFAGTYAMTVVDGANDCQFPNWKDGTTDTNITVQITQDAGLAQVIIPTNTALATIMNFFLGTNSLAGTVSNNELKANLIGTQPIPQGTCTFTVDLALDMTLDSNSVASGTLTYTPVVTKGDASCTVLDSCSNSQTVSGPRTSQ